MKPQPTGPAPELDDDGELDPETMPVCEGDKLAYFKAGIDAALAEGDDGIPHEEVQREMKAYFASLTRR